MAVFEDMKSRFFRRIYLNDEDIIAKVRACTIYTVISIFWLCLEWLGDYILLSMLTEFSPEDG